MARDPRLDPDLANLLAFLDAAATRPMHEGTPAEARASFRTLAVDLRDQSLLPQVEAVDDTTVPGGAGPVAARVYRPRATGPLPTVVFLHGGGWVIGDLDTHDLTCRTIATLCDAVVVSVDYRLAPEHPAPAAYEDALAATTHVHDHLADYGGTEVLGVAGDSAGGNLAAVVAQSFRDAGRPLAGQLLVYPGTDLAGDHPSLTENADGYFLDLPTIAWFMEQYVGHLGGTGLDDPTLSPLRGRLDDLAPAVVVTAQFDPLRDQGAAYAEALSAAGVPTSYRCFDGLIHGFVDMGRHSPAAQAAVEETCHLFRSLLHPTPAAG
ncbi:alpha/beta hydrolase [Nocardioides sp. SYSU D00038]|uniref:alpha/beta hydrolase n=1 Tax=Nocardioides sp. SYSU D00038 TaxID=2812554 RepID=UPI0027DBC1D2|nr:alpha/beta hydrolase [Nocardioides sp. SYSU D00038]